MTGWSDLLERALRVAANAHLGQTRKGSGLPYITHPVGVAMLLQRHGFDDDQTLSAALLHDVVEDTPFAAEYLRTRFPASVVDTVECLSEQKRDEAGDPRPWEVRKREHLEHIASAPLRVRSIALADKLHNLSSMLYDIQEGQDLKDRFNAPLDRLVWYYGEMISAAAGDQEDERLASLAAEARAALQELKHIC
jgi:(p)ppGpp synthase/HD superfamily hydrolase